MADESSNGHGESRLDRMEKLMELLIQDHLAFRDDLRQLLTAQVMLTDRVDKLAENAQHTDDRMNALIAVVDGIVRRGGPPAHAP
jgi:hypothetical protein